MKKTSSIFQLVIALLLAFGVVFSGISPEGFHEHEEELHCEVDHTTEAADSCHLSVFHHQSSNETSCSHTNHLSDFHHHCQLKGYFFAHRVQQFFEHESVFFFAPSYSFIAPQSEQKVVSTFFTARKGRAPPIA